MFVTKRSEETIYGEGGIDASLVEDLLLKKERERERENEIFDGCFRVFLCRYLLYKILMCVFSCEIRVATNIIIRDLSRLKKRERERGNEFGSHIYTSISYVMKSGL